MLAGCSEYITSASLCANDSIFGVSGWFLPSIDELKMMYNNLYATGASDFGSHGIVDNFSYWSSSQQTADMANNIDFPDNGRQHYDDKDYPRRVRAIREIEVVPYTPPDILVSFSGIDNVEVRYYTNVCGWQTVGVFNDSCRFEIPEEYQATWGATTVQALKGGMWYTISGVVVGGDPLVLDIPVKTITLTGLTAACNLGLAQEDWVYRSAFAAAGATVEYPVFDNNKKYIVHLNKTDLPTIYIPDISAGATVDLAGYF
jgi:hypothetical protein